VPQDGKKLEISTGYWDALIINEGHNGATPIIPVSDSHWYTFDTGLFRTSTEPSYNDRPVYFKEDEATSFLNTLDGKTATKPTGQKVNQGGRPFADECNEIADKIAELKSEGLGYPKILREIRFTKCVQKLKQDKILESGEIKKEQLYHKVHSSIKGKKYTALVGISTDTIKKMIENPNKYTNCIHPPQE
jgi:hypothetical protein